MALDTVPGPLSSSNEPITHVDLSSTALDTVPGPLPSSNEHIILKCSMLVLPKPLLHRRADKFCLYCNIFIYFRHIWIKPVLCSCMVSLPSYFTVNTYVLAVLTQCTSKWKSFPTFGSKSLLLLNS
jgi:hypothetical protein